MNQLMENDIKPVTTPADAIEQFIGEQYIEWLMEYVTAEIRTWPEIKILASSKPKPEKIRKLLIQRYTAAQAFLGEKEGDPGFLGFAIANLSESADPEAESALEILEKKKQEELMGQGSSKGIGQNRHHELWVRLLKAVGASDEEIDRAEPKEWTRNYIAELSDLYSNSEWQEVAGAFAAHERAIPEEYGAYLSLIKNNLTLSNQDVEVLTWHAGVDIKYVINTSHILEKIVFDTENKQLVFNGVSRELAVRKEFLEGLVKHLEV